MLDRFIPVALAALALSVVPVLARAAPVAIPKPRPQTAQPAPRPGGFVEGPHKHSLTDIPDMSKAVPASQIGKLPSTEDRYRTLKSQVDKVQPHVESAKAKSDTLKAQAKALREKLVATAARVQRLEETKTQLDGQIATLSATEASLSKSFARDRVAVSHLLGLLERLQHDMPPVLALTADDALSAARSAMLLGASLPRVYGEAAALAKRLDKLRRTHAELVKRRAESARNAVQLSAARTRLDQLLAKKQAEADTAAAKYETLASKFRAIAKQATDLGQLLAKVAALRADHFGGRSIVVVGSDTAGRLRRGSLRRPVVGPLRDGGIDGVGGAEAPGVTFLTQPGAQVVAPIDSKVLFAGRYHKTGQVLILEMAAGYDLVLVGLDRLDVKVGDHVLEGEPVGTMAERGRPAQLYFEMRHDGKGMSPAPWLEVGLRKAEKS